MHFKFIIGCRNSFILVLKWQKKSPSLTQSSFLGVAFLHRFSKYKNVELTILFQHICSNGTHGVFGWISISQWQLNYLLFILISSHCLLYCGHFVHFSKKQQKQVLERLKVWCHAWKVLTFKTGAWKKKACGFQGIMQVRLFHFPSLDFCVIISALDGLLVCSAE